MRCMMTTFIAAVIRLRADASKDDIPLTRFLCAIFMKRQTPSHSWAGGKRNESLWSELQLQRRQRVDRLGGVVRGIACHVGYKLSAECSHHQAAQVDPR